MSFPIIPLLALLGIAVGVTALVWYGQLSAAEKQEADRRALAWLGKRFEDLTASQQEHIREQMAGQT